LLRFSPDESVTLVCFGATPKLGDRLNAFFNARCSEDVLVEPHVVFDVILDGLFHEIDQAVWKMNSVFGGMEHVS
jgi:hypothetical protein